MAIDTASVRVVVEVDPIFEQLARIGSARSAFIRERGKLPARVLLGRENYLAIRGSLIGKMPLGTKGDITVYGMLVQVIPLPDACACVDVNDDEALR